MKRLLAALLFVAGNVAADIVTPVNCTLIHIGRQVKRRTNGERKNNGPGG